MQFYSGYILNNLTQNDDQKRIRTSRRRRDKSAKSVNTGAMHTSWEVTKGGINNPFLNKNPVVDILGDEEIEKIHDTSMRVLENIGINFRGDEETLTLWRNAGATVKGDNVKIPRELAMDLISLAPEEFVQHARNPENSVRFGKNSMVFSPVFASPYVRDLDNIRREATLNDFNNLLKLTYMSSALNHGGAQICEPMDIPVSHRHLEVLYGHLKYSDKPFLGDARGLERAQDSLRMCEISFGKEFVQNNVVLLSLINAASPLLWDVTMLDALKFYARNHQALLITPFVMQGANTPVTIAGALVQLNAEAIAGMALAQLVRAGTPVIYGCTLATVSMKSGSPLYGRSEVARMTFAIGQLARKYKVPFRVGGNRNSAMLSDVTAGSQNTMTILPAIMAHANYIPHAAGWLENSMSVSFAQFILDLDQLALLQEFANGIDVNEDTLAYKALEEISPAGDYFSNTHTLKHYRHIFSEPMIDSMGSYEAWQSAGSKDAIQQGLSWARRVLDKYEPPEILSSVDQELKDYVELRKAELPEIES